MAKDAFADGMTSFRLGQWHSAIFLYNIAQAYRLASETDHALFFYRSYLDADPLLRVRLWRERLYAFVEIGLGVQIVAGWRRSGAELAPGAPLARPRLLDQLM